MDKYYRWYYRQNTFVRVVLHILQQLPFFLIGWLIGDLLFK